MNDDLSNIIKNIRNGKKDYYAKLIQLYNPILRRIGRHYLRNIFDVEDIIQEVWIKVYTKIYTLEDAIKFDGWIKVIMRNKCIDFIRRNKKHKMNDIHYDFSTSIKLASFYSICEEDNCWKNLIDEELRSIIQVMVDKLPKTYSIPMRFFYLDNIKIKKICETLNLPENTVRWRLYQGRKLFKNLIKNYL